MLSCARVLPFGRCLLGHVNRQSAAKKAVKVRLHRRPQYVRASDISQGLYSDSDEEMPPLAKDTLPPHMAPAPTVLSWINEMTKWGVSGTVFAVLLLRRDLLAAWCVLGSILSSALCKAMKHAINESRPPLARKSDPGMPSSHGNSIGFLAAFTAAALLDLASPAGPTASANPTTLARWQAAGIMAVAAFLAWLRVALGYHTWPQLLAGCALGTCTGLGWLLLGTHAALPQLAAADASWRVALYGLTATAVAAFGYKQLRTLQAERQAMAKAA